jgi:tRNA(fMet)-specific endonuclease VapC
MIADTTFLIDLQREARRTKGGGATKFLEQNSAALFSLSAITVMEFEEGFDNTDLDSARDFLAAFPVIDVDVSIARRAGRVRRQLRLAGQLIGDNDILIAATALDRDDTLLSRNPGHLSRIEGLRVVSY